MAEERHYGEIDFLNSVFMGKEEITQKDKKTAIEIIVNLPSRESRKNFTIQLGTRIRESK